MLDACHRCDATHDMDFQCNDLVSTAARHYGGLEHNEFHLLMKLEHGYVLRGLYKAAFNGWFLASHNAKQFRNWFLASHLENVDRMQKLAAVEKELKELKEHGEEELKEEHGEEEPQEDGEEEPQEDGEDEPQEDGEDEPQEEHGEDEPQEEHDEDEPQEQHGEEEPQEDGEDEPQEEHGNNAPVFIISADALEADGTVGGALKTDATVGPLDFQAMRYLNLNSNLKRYVELFGPVQSMDHTTKGFLGRDLWKGMFDLLADYQMQRDFVPTHVGWFSLPRPFSKMQASRPCADDDAEDPSECFYPAYFEVNVSGYVRMACLHILWFRCKFWYVHLDRMRSWTKL